jgi:hypothetical protein
VRMLFPGKITGVNMKMLLQTMKIMGTRRLLFLFFSLYLCSNEHELCISQKSSKYTRDPPNIIVVKIIYFIYHHELC